MISTHEIAWLAGLFEGEGNISTVNYNSKGRGWDYIALSISMTDKDIIDRVAKLWNRNIPELKIKDINRDISPITGIRYKTVYKVSIYEKQATIWLMMMYKFFGERRREKSREAIKMFMAKDVSPRRRRDLTPAHTALKERRNYIAGVHAHALNILTGEG